ncbi:flagellar motor stator protein MotA [Ectothiorhodospira lacustris]|uniref:flagellar motor stator protein MotA n=2 Tax=Ectothiorhodospira lacustris TaxID=2899127 RepID=UPI001EE99A02|nr:flagellar motor stator protein MotA [Ectothiorhodospira lacustris]MCG5521889.1 flagellar motor stator protein MotA [Ectothiorhodospira lacustris]
MNLILGSIIVIVAVLGGWSLHGGQLILIWQPYEFIIIIGAALGAFVIANPMKTIMKVITLIPKMMGGPVYKKDDYMELLSLMYDLFTKARKEGLMGIEGDVEEPENSPLFEKYPRVLKNHHAVEFISDYMRLVVSGSMNSFELDNLMDIDIETHHHEAADPAHAVSRVADGLPAFGIVAAVLGIVNTMTALDGPIDKIGGLVAAALVGTFTGILLAYGFVGPLSNALERRADEESKYLAVLKACILANVQGYSPQVAVEFGRKAMTSNMRPSFIELEQHLRGNKE